MRWLGISFLTITLLTVIACERKLPPQESCNFVQNSDQLRVSWGSKLPVRLYVHHSVPKEYYGAIERAVKQWNDGLKQGRELIHIEGWGTTGLETPGRDGYSVIYWLSDWEASKPTEQARTTIYWTGNRIYEADMRINAHNFTFYGAESSDSIVGVDLESLVIHELGHVLGLAHTTANGSVMVPSLASNTARRDPGTMDIQSLKCEY